MGGQLPLGIGVEKSWEIFMFEYLGNGDGIVVAPQLTLLGIYPRRGDNFTLGLGADHPRQACALCLGEYTGWGSQRALYYNPLYAVFVCVSPVFPRIRPAFITLAKGEWD